jgi:hypothetical protein
MGPAMISRPSRANRVEIAAAPLGTLVNTVTYAEEAAPWVFGIGRLMPNLAERGVAGAGVSVEDGGYGLDCGSQPEKLDDRLGWKGDCPVSGGVIG